MKDESGKPIFIVKQDVLHGVEFWPYEIATIHEYVKAKQEMNKEKECGAV